MDLRLIRLALLLVSWAWIPQVVFGQLPNLQGFGGTIQQPYRSGDEVVLYGTNLLTNQSTCDRILLYTGGAVGDTVSYSPGASIDTPLNFVRVTGAGGVDTLKFRLHKNVACSPTTFVRFRKLPACAGGYQISNILFMETGEKALVSYGGNDSIFCLGDTNVLPLEMQDNVFYSLLYDPGFFTTGDSNNLLDPDVGNMLVTLADTGTYYIRVYTDTLAPGHPTCNDADTVKVQILAISTDAISYGVSSFCPSITSPQALSLAPGDTAGVFTAFPAGLTLDPTTGEITPSTSTPRTYQVTYTPPHQACTSPSVTTIFIDTLSQSLFTYPSGVCSGDTSEMPFFTQYSPGVFTVTALAGFSGASTINPTTGELSSTANTVGPVRVTFTPTDACKVVTNTTVTYLKRPTADFTVGNNGVICLASAGPSVPLVPVSPSATGVWNAPSLTLGVNSIIINGMTPVGGPFYVSYYKDSTYAAYPGLTCGDSFVVPVMIYDAASVQITYPNAGLGFCDGDQLIYPVVSNGALGGQYFGSLLSGSGNFAPNPTTGVVDLGVGSTAASLEIRYAPHIECPDTVVVDTIVITQDNDLSIAFANTADTSVFVCTGDSIISIQLTGTTLASINYDSIYVTGNVNGGTFPGAVSGTDILIGSLPQGGPYPIIRSVSYGACINIDSVYLEIIQTADATFDYLDDLYCEGATNPVPFISGVGGGRFYCTNAQGFNQQLNPITGEIDLNNFVVGTYIIQYTTNNVALQCPDTALDVVQFLGINSAEYYYPNNEVTFCTSDTPSVIYPTLFDPMAVDVWVVTPGSGLVIDTSGGINVRLSSPGVYIVERQIGAPGANCNSIFSREIEIIAGDTSTTMAYSRDVYCQSEDNPFPVIVGDTNGMFYGQVGVQVNGNTGEVNLVGSEMSNGMNYYIITYRIESLQGCVVELKDSLRIIGLDSTSFEYPKEFICLSSPLMSPSQMPNPSNGTFYMVSTAGDTVNYINPLTGDIDVTGANVLGAERFEIFFYPTDTACRLVAKENLAIYQGPDNAQVEILPGIVFCDSQTVSFENVGNGNFWFYINGGNVTNRSWGGQNSDLFQSMDWTDGDQVKIIVYSPVADTLRDSVSGQPIPIQNSPGGYYLDTSSTCIVEFNYTLTEKPLPQLSFVNPIEVSEESQQIVVELTTTVDSTMFVWQALPLNNIDSTFGLGAPTEGPIDSAQTHYFTQYASLDSMESPGYVLVTFIPTASGCVGPALTDTIFVNPNDVSIFIPQAFTPDGMDEFNPTWHIQWTSEIDPKAYNMIVYNRSGGQVYAMNEGLHPNWTGDQVPDGVYWWVLIEKSTNNVIQSGGLTIKRK